MKKTQNFKEKNSNAKAYILKMLKMLKIQKMQKEASNKNEKKPKNNLHTKHATLVKNAKSKECEKSKKWEKGKMQIIAKIRENNGNKTKESQPSRIYQHFVLVYLRCYS